MNSPKVIELKRLGDHRGYFAETYSRSKYSQIGIEAEFVQDNHSLSLDRNTLRGLHFQSTPHAQAKLVRCGRGSLFDVVVDIRRGSPNYGQWVGYELSAENGRQLYIPIGFAHGFVTREPESEIVYKCSDYYAPETEGAVRWDSCGIEWALSCDPILSDKDAAAPLLQELDSPFIYGKNS